MKKIGKIILIIVILLVSTIFIDFISLHNFNKPLFAIKKDNNKYSGLLYDTYNCPENSWFVFKSKFTKFTCVVEEKRENKEKKIVKIEDETLKIKNFICAQALEPFYEDENYVYSYSCIKGSYINVTYEDGTKETVSSALKNGRITIQEVEDAGIHFYKERK